MANEKKVTEAVLHSFAPSMIGMPAGALPWSLLDGEPHPPTGTRSICSVSKGRGCNCSTLPAPFGTFETSIRVASSYVGIHSCKRPRFSREFKKLWIRVEQYLPGCVAAKQGCLGLHYSATSKPTEEAKVFCSARCRHNLLWFMQCSLLQIESRRQWLNEMDTE